ncbi:MAG: hypothetical protein ABI137_11890 [Antricoccus sp.]
MGHEEVTAISEATDYASRRPADQPMTRQEALAMRGAHAIDDVPHEVEPTVESTVDPASLRAT